MASPHLRRRTLLMGAVAAPFSAVNAATAAADPAPAANTLVPWQAARPPALQAVDLASEKTVSLADFAGQPLVINFWATWCGPCRAEMPSLNAAVDRFASRGLRLLSLNHGEMPARVRSFLEEVPVHGSVLLDRSKTQLPAWGGSSLPASFVLDAEGKPRFRAFGEIDWLAAANLSALRSVVT